MKLSAPLLVLLILAGVGLSAGCGTSALDEQWAAAFTRTKPPTPFFSPTGIWNRRVDTAARIDPRSPDLVAALAEEVEAEVAAGTGPWISTTSYSVPVYKVSAEQPTVRVRLAAPFPEPHLQAAWRAVPLPEDARPAAGTDAHLVVWQPATHRLWEFWRLSRTASGWQAAWGGAIRDIWTDRGVYGTNAWPGAQPNWGASASSLSIAGGLIRFADLEAGSIDHTLALSLPRVRAGVYSSPARRTDGDSLDPLALPEGARLRLDPRLDLAKLRMPRLTRMIAKAAQRYGILIRDRAGEITFYGQDPSTLPVNPYLGEDGYFRGHHPSELLSAFPWRDLQVLKTKLHRTS